MFSREARAQNAQVLYCCPLLDCYMLQLKDNTPRGGTQTLFHHVMSDHSPTTPRLSPRNHPKARLRPSAPDKP